MEAVSLADLALSLRADQNHVEEYVQSELGKSTAPNGPLRLSQDEITAVRAAFEKNTNAEPEWSLKPGDTVLRRAIHSAYGGQQQGGISTPRSIPSVFVFTDVARSSAFGYGQYEGLREDGSFGYTGEGQKGEQVFVRGNKALRDSAKLGKTIRLFRAAVPRAQYVGEFTTGTPPYELKEIPDLDNSPRTGIVFNLIPIDAQVDLLSVHGRASSSDDREFDFVAHDCAWKQPDTSEVSISNDFADAMDRTMSRVEFQLQVEFGKWLIDSQTPPRSLSLQTSTTTIQPDFYVPSRNWIVEAKKSTARNYVRLAFGQVLDYVHIAERAGLHNLSPVVLLPGIPEADLLELMTQHGITTVIRNGTDFTVLN